MFYVSIMNMIEECNIQLINFKIIYNLGGFDNLHLRRKFLLEFGIFLYHKAKMNRSFDILLVPILSVRSEMVNSFTVSCQPLLTSFDYKEIAA